MLPLQLRRPFHRRGRRVRGRMAQGNELPPPALMCLTVYLCTASVAACNDGESLLVGGEFAE